MLKRILCFSLGMLLLNLSWAQSPEELEKRYQKKLNETFVKNLAWEQLFEKAMERAKAENKLILGYFTRSYAP